MKMKLLLLYLFFQLFHSKNCPKSNFQVHSLPDLNEDLPCNYAHLSKISTNKNLFYWFFYNQSNPHFPVILFINGGPGASSLIALFHEIGPLKIQKDLNLKIREGNWMEIGHLLFIDNPVKTGLSFSKEFAHTGNEVTEDFSILLENFIAENSFIQNNEFILSGESYGGKYIPRLANKILKIKEENHKHFKFVKKIKIKKIALCSGFVWPKLQKVSFYKGAISLGIIFDKYEKKKNYQFNDKV